MAKKGSIESGVALEARIQRLFMCQGAFADRGLLLRPARAAANLVTDVDVIAHDYSLNLHHTKIYAECKGGKSVSTLDRVVWVRGMMTVLGAEMGYLVLDRCSPESVSFASSHGVEILQSAGLAALEDALRIGSSFWPGRANYTAYQEIEAALSREADIKATSLQAWLRQALEIWREASALFFSYARLNNLLGKLDQLAGILKVEEVPEKSAVLYRFAVGALLVRLSQYLLFAAADTLGMTKTERERFTTDRLTAGTLDLQQTRSVMQSALNLAKAKLEQHGVDAPPNWDAEHLLAAPNYSRAFAEVVDRVVADAHRARLLPLALELRLFGFAGSERASSGLVKRVEYALPLTGLVRGFAIQTLGLPDDLVQGPALSLKGISSVGSVVQATHEEDQANMLPAMKA
jgi:hypothetical protein